MLYNKLIDTFGGYSGSLFDANSKNETVSPECVYQYSYDAANSVDQFLSDFLNGTVAPEVMISMHHFEGPPHIQALYNEGDLAFENIDEIWRNISDSMTTYIRQSGRENVSIPAVGVTRRAQTCVRIQWAFIIYPAILVVLSLIFFASMVLQTRGTKTSRHDWKSSPLALLFHGLDREAITSCSEIAESVGTKEMETIAKETSVRLSKTEDGWNFTRY